MKSSSRLVGGALGIVTLGAATLAGCGSVGSAPQPSTDPPVDPVAQPSAEGVANATSTPRLTVTRRRADGLLPGMIPRRGAGYTPQALPTCKSPSLQYYGGPILQNPTVVAVFWSSAVNPEVVAGMADFYADITQPSTGYWTWLHEYDTLAQSGGTGQVILPTVAPAAPFASGVTLTPSKCATTSKCALTDAQVQTELNAQIEAGHLPEPTLDCTGNSNTVYMVHFPPNVTVTAPGGTGTSCEEFCAYHNTGLITAPGPANGNPLVYGLVMDTYSGGCADGCGGNPASGGHTAAFNNQTSGASHELAESVTDADIGLLPDTAMQVAAPVAWYDENNQCGEIADICDDGITPGATLTGAHGTWVVQKLWSNKQTACVASGTALPICTTTVSLSCRECNCGDNGVDCPVGTTCGGGGTQGAVCIADVVDAGTGDAGGTGMDSGTSDTDSGAASTDAGTTAEDSGATVDSGSTETDSGTAVVDSGTPVADSSTPTVDSGASLVDSGMLAVDSGSIMGADGSVAQMDASGDASEPDGSSASSPAGSSGGCGCRTAGAADVGSVPGLFGLGIAVAIARLRSRRKAAAPST